MIASDWKYVGEGGKHAIFAYHRSSRSRVEDGCCCCHHQDNHDNDNDDDPWRGKLLRLQKTDLANAAATATAASSCHHCPSTAEVVAVTMTGDNPLDESKSSKKKTMMKVKNHDPNTISRDNNYVRTVVQPWLYPYVEEPEMVSLSWEFVRQLHTLALPLVPPFRRNDWYTSTTVTTKEDHYGNHNIDTRRTPHDHSPMSANGVAPPYTPSIDTVLAYRLQDYRVMMHLPQHDNYNYNDDPLLVDCGSIHSTYGCLSVEIKPKAGYRAISPLVDPNHNVKFFQSRFSILQQKRHAFSSTKHTKETTNPCHGDKHCSNVHRSKQQQQKQQVLPMDEDTNENGTMSLYDPIDLFSNDKSRIRSALENLWKCPQNNFSIWMNGNKIVLGETSMVGTNNNETSTTSTSDDVCQTTNGCSSTALAELQHYFFVPMSDTNNANNKHSDNHVCVDHHDEDDYDDAVQESYSDTAKDILLSAITTILFHEPLLSKMLQLQKLDIIDGDGAIIIYQHLLKVTGSSQDELEALIDSNIVTKRASTKVPTTHHHHQQQQQQQNCNLTNKIKAHPLLLDSPFLPPDDPALEYFCEQVRVFSEKLSFELDEQDNGVDGIDNNHNCRNNVLSLSSLPFHDDARQLMLATMIQNNALSKESMIFLLQNWLLSLVMCDASFFVTLRRVTFAEVVTQSPSIGSGTNLTWNASSLSHRNQNNQNPPRDNHNAMWVIQRNYDHEQPGIIFFWHASPKLGCGDETRGPDAVYWYSIHVIDCERKPAQKLRTRSEKEDKFCGTLTDRA